MKLVVDHVTEYLYEAPVRFSTQYLRLTPRDSRASQKFWNGGSTRPARRRARSTATGTCHVLTLDRPTQAIRIRAIGEVETLPPDEGPTRCRSRRSSSRAHRLLRAPTSASAARRKAPPPRRSPSSMAELASAILKMPFKPGGSTLLERCRGVRDRLGRAASHAHVFIACCRYLGVPARYVSGYVYSPGHEEAHVASHAWAEAWTVDRWRSFDIANNRPASEDHIRLAVGADYFEACPIRGVRTGGGAETMSAAALVTQQQQ